MSLNISLEKLKQDLSKLQDITEVLVHIWSDEHGAYWRKHGRGYTVDIMEAWQLPLTEAYNETKYCDSSKRIRFHSVPVDMLLPTNNPFESYVRRQREWSLKTFGEGRRTAGIIKHIQKELKEIEENPSDLTEWVDVIILAIDGFYRHGGKPEELMLVLQLKQDKNFTRTYPFPQTEDEPTEHVRDNDIKEVKNI